mmetsp:Transcript_4622/g.6452  ORF Transcript_4622/g.6452 Transcript_4622/m.6452 type:complete len:202 (+) Transcript_4622:72-677(+)
MASISLELPENASEIVGPTDWSNWVIKGRVIAGAYPGHQNETEHREVIQQIIHKGNVTTFVCLQTEKELGRFRSYKEVALTFKEDLQFVHFPIADQNIANFDAVYHLVEDLKSRLHNGEVLYIHCWGGHGRTGTIIGCLLARLFDLSGDKALELTQKFHSCRKICKSTSPQHPSQFKQVRDMAARYQKEKEESSSNQNSVV